MEMITKDQFEELRSAIKGAENDETPYIGIKDDDIHVLGNPNNTEIKPADYMVHFTFPNTEEWRARAEATCDEIGKTTADGRYFLAKRKYTNIYLSPRRVGGVIAALAQIESFIFKTTENGEVKDLSEEEIRTLLMVLNGELSDAVYEVVASVLRIPYEEMEWMTPTNAVENAVKIALNNPSAVNESDLFFGSPHDK